MSEIKIKNFSEIPYEQLEELNLQAKQKMADGNSDSSLQEHYLRYLSDEKRLKAVTVCFSDLEGRFHMLDYDKKFLIQSYDNLTFDGSSIRGFSVQSESDLRLAIDWGTLRWLPSDVFGPGKVMVFALIQDRNRNYYDADMRGQLKLFNEKLRADKGITTNFAVETEGFLFKGLNAEQHYAQDSDFQFVSEGGYFNTLPTAPLRQFIDRFAEAQRALGFENEKDHPEVAPSQFELNYKYTDALIAADQVQTYKLLARLIASNMGYTASFLPKPKVGVNGSGMHTNISLSKNGKNIFWDANGPDLISKEGWNSIDRILGAADGLCLILNPSVNSYRRLDPHYEAPNQIRTSAVDRSAMIRIPIGNEKSARIEIRSVAPDANPYLTFYSVLKTMTAGPLDDKLIEKNRTRQDRILPDNIQDAIQNFENDKWMAEVMGERIHRKYAEIKHMVADRSPKALGSRVKMSEVLFHHEVTNQQLWSFF
ncbi:MAG: glutamine synthetase family protein [Bdellovibrionota bacterium]|nr:MAG: glutamine synthetase [Pseudomonadota bacterium]